jgi:flagellar biosynthetic protein FliS
MTYESAPLIYRRAASQQASVVGLVIALCDTLTGNLQRAANAIEDGNVQLRCDELTHGFRVLTQLDAMLDMKDGGETAIKLRRFYNHVRQQMLAAQFKLDSRILYSQVAAVLEVRSAWQHLDEMSAAATAPRPAGSAYLANQDECFESTASFSCSG